VNILHKEVVHQPCSLCIVFGEALVTYDTTALIAPTWLPCLLAPGSLWHCVLVLLIVLLLCLGSCGVPPQMNENSSNIQN